MKKYEEGEKPRLPFIQATLMKYSPEYPLAEQAGFNSSILIIKWYQMVLSIPCAKVNTFKPSLFAELGNGI